MYATDLYISEITIQELEIGVLLAERRDPSQGSVFREWMNGHVLPAFTGRILAIDTAVAQRSARLHVPDPRPFRDGLIAATALVHGMTVVTRNVADFERAILLIPRPSQANTIFPGHRIRFRSNGVYLPPHAR